MNTFPITLSRSPGWKGYSEELNKNAVQVARTASGYPVLNELFTFQSKIWKYTLSLVVQADKETILTFYEANKGVPIYWENEQEDGTTYEVIFLGPPRCRLDRLKTRWKMIFNFEQSSPL